MSVKINVKFKNGTRERRALVFKLIKNAIIPGKNDINMTGVRALCASLNVLHLLATAIFNPLIRKE